MIGTERSKKMIYGVLRMIAGIAWEDPINTLRREGAYAPRKRTSQKVNAAVPHLFNPLVGQGDVRTIPKLLPPPIICCSQPCIFRFGGAPRSIHRLLSWLAERLVSD